MRRLVLCAVVLAVLASSAAGDVPLLASPRGTVTAGRSLLQIRKKCPANLEAANYTAVTSRCKGPDYNETRCCAAYRDMACPYADYINDQTTNCAATMFSYLRFHGRYPPGLFANTCTEATKNGLRCPDVGAAATAAAAPPYLVATAFAFYVYYMHTLMS